MNNIPSKATKVAQADSAFFKAVQQSKDTTLSKAQRQRAKQISEDIKKHAAKLGCAALIVLSVSGQAIAAERWLPSPTQGEPVWTMSTGRR